MCVIICYTVYVKKLAVVVVDNKNSVFSKSHFKSDFFYRYGLTFVVLERIRDMDIAICPYIFLADELT